MAENKMKEVAKLLGVELEEEFRLLFVNTFSNGIYKLNKSGLVFKAKDNKNWQTTNKLHCLLNGNCEIVKLPKPILDNIEKKYLSSLIKPFRAQVVSITKIQGNYGEFISITIDEADGTNDIDLPWFKPDGMYKGMKIDKRYTLEELGL